MASTDFAPGVPELRLCLDFVNTEGEVRSNPPDRLETFEAFTEWASAHGLGEIRAPKGGEAEAFLARARELRETLYRTFAALTQGAEPEPDDLSELNGALARAASRLRLAPGESGLTWGFEHEVMGPDDALDRIVISAASLLTSDRLGRVKECASDTCGWMFIDESRNHSRRWCDMSDCGNRAKARRYYHRHAD